MKKSPHPRKRLNQLKVGATAVMTLMVSEDALNAFGDLSGDKNAIHCDESFARHHGFEGRVVYGAQIVAHISRLLGMRLPGKGWIWHSLNIQFRSPLYLRERAKLKGRVVYSQPALGIVRIELKLTRGKRVLAEGEAQVGRLPRS